jgi:uncharacterized Rossmann fold enzyme
VESVREPTAEEHRAWHQKHDVLPDADGYLDRMPDGKAPASDEELLANIKANAALFHVPNLKGTFYKRATMVFVAGGPSASDFIEEIRAKSLDQRYDVFCSNATAGWLLKQGITPKYQVIIDPKREKVRDVMHGNEQIHYLIGLQCAPELFMALDGKTVAKFLASSSTAGEEYDAARAACHDGDPHLVAIGGGTMMGTRAITLANAMGYRRIEYYGFDGSVRMDGSSVKMYAYHKPRTEAVTIVVARDGRSFFSTLTFSRQANELAMLLPKMPWLDVVIHGDGFLAHDLALQKAARKTPGTTRISAEYLEMQRQMHAMPEYGSNHSNLAVPVYLLASQMARKLGSCDVLDYGCGKEALRKSIEQAFSPAINTTYRGYDPASLAAEPRAADLVVCADVMEHVEIECVDAVLDHIKSLARHAVYFSISLVPAKKTLPDGRNAHITLLAPDDWLAMIKCRWIVTESSVKGSSLIVVGQVLPHVD